MTALGLFPAEPGRIGSDESGKGDFFGPLVIAAFFMPEGQEEALRELGVKDSKRTSDARCREIAETLKRGYPYHSVVTIGPEKYNELYAKLRNLNRLLAWGHARAIENILDRVPAGKAVTDQFGDEKFVRNALLKKGREIELVQMPGAEDDAAVAAASILARAEFLTRLHFLSKDVGVELPKGASDLVEAAAVKLVREKGPGILDKVAKTHFKTTVRVLAAAGIDRLV
ncbi:MAG: ribonuclease HIII [Candidatus Aminicenantes bacterium RBG_16_63_14]|nr:MAG: ribonuclease HIII [Candidatus Aminicenantes bacterium RBG_16_63_14]